MFYTTERRRMLSKKSFSLTAIINSRYDEKNRKKG
jgi:hypothetical protein